MRATVAAVALVAALGAAGCSSSTSGGGHGTGTETSPAVSSPASLPASSAPVSTPLSSAAVSSASPATGGLTQQQAADAVLTASEVGGDFQQTTSDDSSSPLPCTPNDPPLDQRFSPSAKAQADFTAAGGQVALSEEIIVYADEATTEQVLAAGENGLSCKKATLHTASGDVQVTLDGPSDLTGTLDVQVDKSEGWQVSAPGQNLALVVSKIGQQLVVLTFTAADSVDTSKLPDAKKVAEDALTKVNDALS